MNTNNWTHLAAIADLPVDDVVELRVGNLSLAVYVANGEVFATQHLCSHGNARLCDGFLDGFEIECPLHQGKFDIRTGKPSCAPASEEIRTYPVKIDGGRVYVAVG